MKVGNSFWYSTKFYILEIKLEFVLRLAFLLLWKGLYGDLFSHADKDKAISYPLFFSYIPEPVRALDVKCSVQ